MVIKLINRFKQVLENFKGYSWQKVAYKNFESFSSYIDFNYRVQKQKKQKISRNIEFIGRNHSRMKCN